MPAPNVLYYGDNLEVLRDHVATDSVDLIYLDPPFNSNVDYNVLIRESSGASPYAQIKAFTDTWHWTEPAEATYNELVTSTTPRISKAIQDVHGRASEARASERARRGAPLHAHADAAVVVRARRAAILDLRSRARGKGWGMRLFHDKLLNAGSLPPKLLARDIGLEG